MKVYGQLFDDGVIQFPDFYEQAPPETPGFTYVEVPEYFMKYTPKVGFKLEDSKVKPISDYNFKEILNNEIANKRWLAQEKGSISYNGNDYPTDKSSIGTITSSVALGQIVEAQNGAGSFTTPWKSLTGFVELNLNDLIQIGVLCGGFTNSVFGKESEYKEAIDNAGEDYESMVKVVDDAFEYLKAQPEDPGAISTGTKAKVARKK